MLYGEIETSHSETLVPVATLDARPPARANPWICQEDVGPLVAALAGPDLPSARLGEAEQAATAALWLLRGGAGPEPRTELAHALLAFDLALGARRGKELSHGFRLVSALFDDALRTVGGDDPRALVRSLPRLAAITEDDLDHLADDLCDRFLFKDEAQRQAYRTRWRSAAQGILWLLRSTAPDGFDRLVTTLEMLCNLIDGSRTLQLKGELLSYVDTGRSAEVVGAILECLLADPLRTTPHADIAELCAAMVEARPNQRSFLLIAGRAYLRRGDFEKAAETARSALRIQAQCQDSQRLLYDALIARKRRGEQVDAPDISLDDLSDRFCQRPFINLVTGYQGESFICDCPAYVPFNVGNVLDAKGADAVWNSDAAQEIRRSIIDGDFRYCSRTLCGLMKDGLLPKRDAIQDPVLQEIIENRQTRVETGPGVVQVSHDPSCNLACPSCRTEIITLKGSLQDRYEAARERVVLPLLERTRGLAVISGGGDPFASKHYRSILAALSPERCPDLQLSLLTNGLMLNERQWNEFADAHRLLSSVMVSVDAARPETYKIVRRPGQFEKLLPNLEFLARKRAEGAFPVFGLCFVVQKLNFREMPEFVELGRRLNVDRIWFQRVINFGSYTPQETREVDVAAPDHPDHAEFQEVLKHPAMSDKSVFLFSDFLEISQIDPLMFTTESTFTRLKKRIRKTGKAGGITLN